MYISQRTRELLYRIAMTVITMIGVFAGYRYSIMCDTIPSVTFVSVAAELAICIALTVFAKKRIIKIAVSAAAVVGTAIVSNPIAVFNGACGMVNFMIKLWNVAQEDGIPTLALNITKYDINVFSIVFMMIFTALMWNATGRRRFIPTVIIVILFELSMFVFDNFSALSSIFLITGCVGIWLGSFYGRLSEQVLAWLVIFMIIIVTAFAVLPNSEVKVILSVRREIGESIHHFRYGEDTLPHGDLYKAHLILSDDSNTLKITTESTNTMYLRGFVGGRYRDGIWEKLPGASYGGDRYGLMSWLRRYDFEPLSQYAEYNDLCSEKNEKVPVDIDNDGADREYIYVPYSAQDITGRSIAQDEDLTYVSSSFFGKTRYKFSECSSGLPAELLHTENWVKEPSNDAQAEYIDKEAVYREFVYDSYLDVPEDMVHTINNIFWSSKTERVIGAYAVTEHIRNVLSETAVYKEEPKAVPHDQNPILWFLKEGKEGGTPLFASAAVLAYRAYGVPARYAEGYLKTEGMPSAGNTMILTDKDSHAWVEIYLDGIGWIPVDVTPGFYYETRVLKQMVEQPHSIKQMAKLQENDTSADEMWTTGTENGNGQDKSVSYQIGYAVLGIITIFILLICGAWFVLEVRRGVWQLCFWRLSTRKGYEHLLKFLCYTIEEVLNVIGIKTRFGQDTDLVDKQICKKVPYMKRGEYKRICSIAEKHYYGGEPLNKYEIRLIKEFAKQLYLKSMRSSRWVWLRLYFHL